MSLPSGAGARITFSVWLAFFAGLENTESWFGNPFLYIHPMFTLNLGRADPLVLAIRF